MSSTSYFIKPLSYNGSTKHLKNCQILATFSSKLLFLLGVPYLFEKKMACSMDYK